MLKVTRLYIGSYGCPIGWSVLILLVVAKIYFMINHVLVGKKCSVYLFGTLAVGLISFFLLRDTTPIQFVPSQMSDMDRPRGEMASKEQLEDVYWRVSIRHASTTLEEICKTEDYTVLTHKNIVMDGKPMEQSYIYLCQPIGDIRSVLNVRGSDPSKKWRDCHMH